MDAKNITSLQIHKIDPEREHRLSQLHHCIVQSSRETNLILSSIPDGILIISNEGMILACNYHTKRLLDIPENTPVLNCHYSKFLSDSFFGISLKEMFLTKLISKTIFLSLDNSNGPKKDIEVFIKKSTVPSNNIFILIKDLSHKKQLDNVLDRYKKISETSEMVATLAHEVRNPLCGIEGFAALLQAELSCPRHKRMATAIIEGTRSLNNLVSSILEYTKTQPLQLKSTNLQLFLDSLFPLLLVAYPTIKLIKETSKDIIKEIDPDRIKSIIWNLVKNASEASKGFITIILTKKGYISVSNNSQGNPIPSEIRSKIFTPFFTTKANGHGLGLAESMKVMKMHNGDIHVYSDTYTTTFTLIIIH